MVKPFLVLGKGREFGFQGVSVISYDVDIQMTTYSDLLESFTIPSTILHHLVSEVAIIIVPAQECIDGKVVVSKDKSKSEMVEYYFYRPEIVKDYLPDYPKRDDFFLVINWRSLRSKRERSVPFELIDIAIRDVAVQDRLKNFIKMYGDLSDYRG